MTTWFRGLVAALAVMLAGCEHHDAHDSPDAPTHRAIDAQADAPGLVSPAFPATITVGASNGTVADAFTVDISGSAGAPLGAMAFTNDVGTFGIAGATPAAFAYAMVPDAPYTLYDGFAVGSASWNAFYMYCESGLVDVYDEGISGAPLFFTTASGTCAGTTTTTNATVSLPAFSIPTPTPVTGYTVSGTEITVSGNGTGALVIAGRALPLIVFGVVDCTACGGSGWFELHSVVWDAVHARVVFVIIYLQNGTTTSVELAYARSLPDLADPIGIETLPATWSATSGRVELMQTRGVPPPRPEAAQSF